MSALIIMRGAAKIQGGGGGGQKCLGESPCALTNPTPGKSQSRTSA